MKISISITNIGDKISPNFSIIHTRKLNNGGYMASYQIPYGIKIKPGAIINILIPPNTEHEK